MMGFIRASFTISSPSEETLLLPSLLPICRLQFNGIALGPVVRRTAVLVDVGGTLPSKVPGAAGVLSPSSITAGVRMALPSISLILIQ